MFVIYFLYVDHNLLLNSHFFPCRVKCTTSCGPSASCQLTCFGPSVLRWCIPNDADGDHAPEEKKRDVAVAMSHLIPDTGRQCIPKPSTVSRTSSCSSCHLACLSCNLLPSIHHQLPTATASTSATSQAAQWNHPLEAIAELLHLHHASAHQIVRTVVVLRSLFLFLVSLQMFLRYLR